MFSYYALRITPAEAWYNSAMSTLLTLMTVHAHPDDEVVFTGGLLALAHDQGIRTVLVCGTGGEEGEIHDPDLDVDTARPQLGQIRRGELDCAVAHLGVDHLEMLGYRDSGMVKSEANAHPGSFHQADRAETTARVVALVRRYQPQVLVTYNDFGAYGHPDHIAAHLATMAAWDVAGDPAYRPDLGAPWTPLKLYYCAWNEEGWKTAHAAYDERGLKWPFDREEGTDDDPEHQSSEEAVAEAAEEKPPAYEPPPVTARLDVRATVARKVAAARCHRTQFDPNGPFMTMPDDVAPLIFGVEHYTLIRSRVETAPEETDLFAGLTAEVPA